MVLIRILDLGPTVILLRSAWFPVLLACAMTERLAAFASDIAIERDWITQVSSHCLTFSTFPKLLNVVVRT